MILLLILLARKYCCKSLEEAYYDLKRLTLIGWDVSKLPLINQEWRKKKKYEFLVVFNLLGTIFHS